MSYNTIYTVPFKSYNNTTYQVDIQQEGFTGEAVELIGGTSPFTVTIDDEDFLYTPIRFSSAKLKVVGDDYLQNLLSTNYQQYRVLLKCEGVVLWRGFIKPEMYTQDYTSVKFELSVECLSAMSTLEFLDYKKESDSYVFITLWNLLKKCVSAANAEYTYIYIPHVYSTDLDTYDSLTNVLENMKVSEQNFFDEEGKALKLKDVLEELCKLLNWTCVDWKGDLYFVDIDHKGQYYEYTGDFTSYQMVSFSEANIQDIGFAGSDNTLDGLGGYSKASVKTSNYNVSDIFPTEDFDKLSSMQSPSNIIDGDNISVKRFYFPSVYKLYHYSDYVGVPEVSESIASMAVDVNSLLGAMPVKVQSYKKSDNITNYNFEEAIQVRRMGSTIDPISNNKVELGRFPILEFKSKLPVASYASAAIAVSCSIRLIKRQDMAYFDDTFESLNSNMSIYCQLSIGDKYWDGFNKIWTTDASKGLFMLVFNKDELSKGGYVNNMSTKTLEMPYSGVDGHMIILPEIPLSGELKFKMFAIDTLTFSQITGYYIKGLKVSYKKLDSLEDKTSEKSDRIYSNVVNSSFVNELDEIEFKMSSWNNDDVCFAKVLLGSGFLKDNLYCSIYNSLVRPEENLIRRIIDQYSATKIKLNQVLIYSPLITPVSLLSDNYMTNKRFINTGGEIDFEADRFEVKMIEA